MNKITVIGSGYVGLVLGTCLADIGNIVTCVDIDKDKIDQLNKGDIPIYEPGLERKVKQNINTNKLRFTSDMHDAIDTGSVIFIAVGTPPLEDGSADIQHVLDVSRNIGRYMDGYKLIVVKSTVPVGTGQKVKDTVNQMLKERGVPYTFDVVSNPEFLREGSAVYDFMNPDRIIIGVESPKARALIIKIYEDLCHKDVPYIITNIQTSELIKYASNAFLAMKVTFINEMAHVCEKVGADAQQLAQGIGTDKRIGLGFLKPGPGYGGSCFPKDTRAIVKIGLDHDVNLSLVQQTIEANERIKLRMADKIQEVLSDLDGKTIGILGITFKAETDDMREAPALTIIEKLTERGAKINVFDPQCKKEGALRLEFLKESVKFCRDEYEASNRADAIVILTDWFQFLEVDIDKVFKLMRGHIIFDFRNMFDRDYIENKGFLYIGIGR